MQGEEGIEPVTGPWEAFALAVIAPLGPFTHVHVAPKIPPALLNHALFTYLPLQGDELILALVDRGGSEPGGCCALTTRRIYWEETRDAMRRRSEQTTGQANDRRPVVLIARYRDLPETIANSIGPDGSVRLDLGGGRAILLKGVDKHLGEPLARFLERMSTADRRGTVPSVGEVAPHLAARIPQVLPSVARLTAQSRAFRQDLVQFRSALQSAPERPLATWLFILACMAVFAAMVASGVPARSPMATELITWGANDGSRVVVRGEFWRLFSSVFIHGGLLHLGLNMWSLFAIGPLVERIYGNVAFAVIYLAAGVGGAIASIAASPLRVGVGASGAICGVLGALVAFLVMHRRSIPASLLKSLGNNVLGVIVLMVILGWVVPNIDQEAHFGGLVTGFVSGLALCGPWPVVRSRLFAVRRGIGALVIAAALAGAAYGVTRRAMADFAPARVIGRIAVQLAELNAIGNSVPSSLELRRDRDAPEAHDLQVEAIEELAQRAARNLERLGRALTPDPRIENMVRAVIQAQTSQIAALDAARRYLDTGDLSDLTGPAGLLKMKTATRRALQSFQQQEIEYLRLSNLIQVRQQEAPRSPVGPE